MIRSPHQPLLAVAALVLASGLAGCQKKTETVVTPSGTETTTSVTPSPAASAQVGRALDAAGDAAITAKVKTALLADPDVKALQIDVDTREGAVTLTGSAGTQPNLERAAAVAKGIDGVKSVDNRLVVGPATASASAAAMMSGASAAVGRAVDRAGEAVGDAAITAKVKSAFLVDTDVKGLQIDVDTHDGVVTLNGTLDQRAQVDKAARIAKAIDGVKSVDNRLKSRAG